MTSPSRALTYPGDRTDAFRIGQAMGPGHDGFYRRVTAVTFADGKTRVELEVMEMAGEGERLRYFGDADGTDQLPPGRAPLTEEITPQ